MFHNSPEIWLNVDNAETNLTTFTTHVKLIFNCKENFSLDLVLEVVQGGVMIVFNPQTDLAHFRMSELFSPETISKPHLLDRDAALALERTRMAIGRPFLVNHQSHHLRGVRSIAEQIELLKAIPTAAKDSMHVLGKAFDVTPVGGSLSEFVELVEKMGWGGIGLYNSFVHLDFRPSPDGVVIKWDFRG